MNSSTAASRQRYMQPMETTDHINPNFMKFIYCLLLGSLITTTLHSQNCKTLDSKPFFSSIKFGDPLPPDLLLCLNTQKFHYPYNAIFLIEQDSLKQDCKNRYSDLFTFLSTPFSVLQANTTFLAVLLTLTKSLFQYMENQQEHKEQPVLIHCSLKKPACLCWLSGNAMIYYYN